MSDELGDILGLARRLAADARELLLEGLRRPALETRTKSSATDLVTEADRASERLIVAGIEAARPGDGVRSEEGASAAAESGYRWLIDPIDGTTNYVYGHPGFAISIAVEREGEVVVGVVDDPLHGDVFTAIRGRGAHRNEEPIATSEATELAQALVATGFGYDPARRRAQAEVVVRLIGEVRDIRRMGAAAVDLCSVACGRVDAYYERGLNDWDLAAGALIALEAGAKVGAIAAERPLPDSLVAAPPALYEPLRKLLVAAGAAAHA